MKYTIEQMLTMVHEAAKAAQISIEARIEEDMILCENVTISPAEIERKRIGGSIKHPGWEVSKTVNRPAKHPDEQDDVQVYEMGEATDCYETIICLFLSTIIRERTEVYWNNLSYNEMLAEFEESNEIEKRYKESKRPTS